MTTNQSAGPGTRTQGRTILQPRANVFLNLLYDLGEVFVLAAQALSDARARRAISPPRPGATHEETLLEATPKPAPRSFQEMPAFQGETVVITYDPLTWPDVGSGGGGGGGGADGGGGGGGGGGADAGSRTTGSQAQYTEQANKNEWSSCAEAGASLQQMDGSPGKPFAAAVSWDLMYNTHGTSTRQPDGSYQFNGTAKAWAVITMTLPVWTNLPSDAGVQAAWSDCLDALQQHESGHVDIINQGMTGLGLDGSSVTGNGADPAAAAKDAAQHFEKKLADLRDQITSRQNLYEQKTDHGRNQAAVGGKNVQLKCPAP